MGRFTGLIGIAAILAVCWALSSNRKAIRGKTIFWGVLLQFVFAVVILKGEAISGILSAIPLPERPLLFAVVLSAVAIGLAGKFRKLPAALPSSRAWLAWSIPSAFLAFRFNWVAQVFESTRVVVNKIMGFTVEGAGFVFGALAKPDGEQSIGFIFAFQVLPTIIFLASIFAILYYFGIMQAVVRVFARLMTSLMGASGAESLSTAASVFLGQTEAPLTIRPFLEEVTESELLTIMTAGMATVSGAIMVAYHQVAGVDIVHLLTASIMVAPGSIVLSKMLIPETGSPKTGSNVDIKVPSLDVNVIDAAARGAGEGVMLGINVAAMLVAFIALVALINSLFGWTQGSFAGLAGGATDGTWAWLAAHVPTSLQQLFGWLFRPVALLIGVPAADAGAIGNLLGTRLVLNEFIAFVDLGKIAKEIDPKSFTIATYALCGFANFSSIAIQVGGIGALAPGRRHDLARLGLRTVLAATLANFMTACIAGMLL